jgi:hypothetical protein
MKHTLVQTCKIPIIGLVLLPAILSAQLRADRPDPAVEQPLKSIAGSSWLDPQRFNMQHGFSVSYLSGTGNMPGLGLSVYSNQLQYLITGNMAVSSRIYLIQPMAANLEQLNQNNPMVFYQADFDWRPRANMSIHLGFSNLPPPRYSYWNPYRAAPLYRFQMLEQPTVMDR